MNGWDRRIDRSKVLEKEYPAARELLRFYRQIALFQESVQQDLPPVSPLPAEFSLHPAQLPEPVRPHVWRLLDLIVRAAPPALAKVAERLNRSGDWDPADPAPRFLSRVLVQPYAEHMARGISYFPQESSPNCPFCREYPVVAVLRPEGEGGKRSLLCSLCSTEWTFRRLFCPRCGEEGEQNLPIFTAGQFPHIRIEACDSCRTYVKSIDMTRNGLAVPEVDDVASLPLDLWAAEHNYTKLQPNLFGL